MTNTKRLLDFTRAELEQSKQQNALLTKQLAAMKIEYKDAK